MTTSDTKSIASHELPATRLDPELAARRAEKIKVSMISLCGCWGCTLSFLDVDERLLRFFDVVAPALAPELPRVRYVDLRYTNGFAVGWRASADAALAAAASVPDRG